MIKFINVNQEKPYLIFKEKYDMAIKYKQKKIEAMSISSYNKINNEVECRYVNCKFIDKDCFIFFTNYNSPKSISFRSHDQVSIVFFWVSINAQIRINAKIKRTSDQYNSLYFKKRSKEKNALAISSNQSNPILNFEEVISKYNIAKLNNNLEECPEYWGGFKLKPYKFEFWQGDDFRLNRRDLYLKNNNGWSHSILEP